VANAACACVSGARVFAVPLYQELVRRHAATSAATRNEMWRAGANAAEMPRPGTRVRINASRRGSCESRQIVLSASQKAHRPRPGGGKMSPGPQFVVRDNTGSAFVYATVGGAQCGMAGWNGTRVRAVQQRLVVRKQLRVAARRRVQPKCAPPRRKPCARVPHACSRSGVRVSTTSHVCVWGGKGRGRGGVRAAPFMVRKVAR